MRGVDIVGNMEIDVKYEFAAETIARAIYEKRNGAGAKQWHTLPKSHKLPYLSDASAVFMAVDVLNCAIVPDSADHATWSVLSGAISADEPTLAVYAATIQTAKIAPLKSTDAP